MRQNNYDELFVILIQDQIIDTSDEILRIETNIISNMTYCFRGIYFRENTLMSLQTLLMKEGEGFHQRGVCQEQTKVIKATEKAIMGC